MKITKTPSGSYRTVLSLGIDPDSGKRLFKTVTAKSKPELQSKAAEITAMYENITFSTSTFYSAALEHIEMLKPTRSQNTITDYESRLRTLNAVCPEFCRLKLHQIHTQEVQKVINRFLTPHKAVYRKPYTKEAKEYEMKAVSEKSARNYWSFIRTVLKANEYEIKAPTFPQKVLPEIYVPDNNEMRTLLNAAEGELSICLRLAVFGMMREGEICALGLEDFNGNIAHVSKGVAYHHGGGYSIKSYPKTTKSNRYIELPDQLVKDIMAQGYVTHFNPKVLRKRFKKLIAECGLHDFRFHDLRHYSVSALHSKNIPDQYIQKRGGWSTPRTLQAVYRHTLADVDKSMTEIAINHFNSLVEKP